MTVATAAECRIEARPIDARRCKFVVDRPLLPERWAYFGDRNQVDPLKTPLIARLFNLQGISGILLAHDKLTITRETPPGLPILGPALRVFRSLMGDESANAESWKRLGGRIAFEVREHWKSGLPAIVDPSSIRVPTPEELRARVVKVLDEEINPVLAGHGGSVSIVGLIDNVVYLTMSGGCQGCGLADMTLKHGVEAAIRDAVPEIGEIIDLTNHAEGSNPFFASSKERCRIVPKR